MIVQQKFNISFQPSGKSIDIISGMSLMEAAWLAGIRLASACGAKGKCGQCTIRIREGKVSSPGPREVEFFKEDDLDKGYRLACYTYAEGDITVHVPKKSLLLDDKLQVESQIEGISVDPIIFSYEVKVKPATLDDPKADLDRVRDALADIIGQKNLVADIAAAKQLSPLLRQNNWRVNAYVRSGEIIGFAPQGARPIGLAVDLGTTKIAAYLLDLATGEELSSAGVINPQSIYGDDVMSRLSYVLNNTDPYGPYSLELTKTVRESIENMIVELTAKAGHLPIQVADMCIVGNTAMTHLLLYLPVRQLATSPYVASNSLAFDIKARELDLSISPGAYVHILPTIGGFVGPDHVAMILASDIDRSKGTTLGLDIGTNTEIVIKRPDLPHMLSLSCPSGPAFEGAHVTDGMRAAKGAIESVKITEQGVEYRTIGDTRPIGICGSGMIDIVAELYRWDMIDERGRFIKKNKRVGQGEQGSEFQLVSGDKGHGVVITQKDIDEIQLAKGAIRAGIEVVLESTGLSPEAVTDVIISGAFGSYINIISGIDIGLLPHFPKARYRQVGNSAAVGAKRALLSWEERKRAESIAAETDYLELTTYPNFNRKFALGMMFAKKIEDRGQGTKDNG